MIQKIYFHFLCQYNATLTKKFCIFSRNNFIKKLEIWFQTIYSMIIFESIYDTQLWGKLTFHLDCWNFLSLREIFFLPTLQWYFCSNLVLSIHIWRQGDPRLDVLDLVYHLIWIFWKWNKNCYDLEGSSMHINEIEMINEKLYL